ncbi:zinc finger protein 845-like [Belonocnema kinseyi]|uniref:zinc finger protein 845-like n=1 Tax=Belonocnema kinseyi TaxID=2817044 RepID=UPI00143D6307|nr:zinc finger protein 845-like [Belonocnema kinseyi]
MYKCEKCMRNYRQKRYLSYHQKYECDVTPQFRCQDGSLKISSRPNCNLTRRKKLHINDWKHQREEHNLISEINQLDGRRITTDISSENYSVTKTSIEYDIDATLEIKEEVIKDPETSSDKITSQNHHIKYELKLCTVDIRGDDILSASKPQGQTKRKIQESKQEPEKNYACDKCARTYKKKRYLSDHKKYVCNAIAQFEFQNRSGKTTARPKCKSKCEAKSSTNVSKNQSEEHNRISEVNQLKERCACITTDISSRNYSDDKPLIEYNNDETWKIKDEGIQDRGTSSEKVMNESNDKKFEFILCTADVRLDDNLANIKPQRQRKPKIPEAKQELQKKYTCEKCARSYAQKHNLTAHEKYECNVIPRFKCKFCQKRFKRKNHLCSHVDSVHLKTDLQTSKTRHNCDKCSRSYSWLKDLNRHKRSVHEENELKVVCDYCGYKTSRKGVLTEHISSLHLKEWTKRNIKR